MADTSVAITAGSGTAIDTRTEATNGNHRQVVVLGDPATNAGVAPVDATAGLKVDLGADNDVTITSGTVTTVSTVTNVATIGTSVTPGTAAANLGKAEDAAHASGDVGVMALAVRTATAPTDRSAGATDGDYEPLQVDANGRLYVNAALYTAAGAAITQDTQGTQDTALGTITSVTGAMAMLRASAAAPTGVSADDDAVLPWALRNGSQVVQLASSGTLVGLVDDAAFTPGTSAVIPIGFQADEGSTDSVDEGDAGAARMTLDRKVITTPQPHTAGGCTIFRSIDLDETEEEVKATAGQVYGGLVTNTSTGTRWLKFYNATAANTTVGTTTPLITWGIPGNATDDIAAVFNNGGMGIAFDTAITVAATTGVADADTGAPGANDVIINLFYK